MENLNLKTYLNIFYLIVAITIISLAQPFVVDLNLASQFSIQLFFATCKAFLIVAYYMHVKMDVVLIRVFMYFSLSLLASFFIIFFIDTYYRAGIDIFE